MGQGQRIDFAVTAGRGCGRLVGHDGGANPGLPSLPTHEASHLGPSTGRRIVGAAAGATPEEIHAFGVEHEPINRAQERRPGFPAHEVGESRGFDSDDDAVDVFWAAGEQSFTMMAKTKLAVALIKLIGERYLERSGPEIQSELPDIAARD